MPMAMATSIHVALLSSSSSSFLSSVSLAASRPLSLSSPRSQPPLMIRACEVDPDQKPKPKQQLGPDQNPTPNPQEPRKAPPTVTAKKGGGTSFFDVFAFGGPAPETINGRLAMLGFAAAIAMEATTGQALTSQIRDGDGVQWFVLLGLVISVASLVPMFKGVSRESKSGAIMSVQAETWNGRAAMLGLVALALTEYIKRGPLI